MATKAGVPQKKKLGRKKILSILLLVLLATTVGLAYCIYDISKRDTPNPKIVFNVSSTVPNIPAGLSKSAVMILVVDADGNVTAGGSGVIVEKRLIITNNHVVSGVDVGGRVQVHLDDRQIVGSIVDKDPPRDLAVISTTEDLEGIISGFKFDMNYGDGIIIIGAPLGVMDVPTIGLFNKYIELDGYGSALVVACNSFYGNSGGPVFDAKTRKLIGIAFRMMGPVKVGPAYAQMSHVTFCIPAATVMQYLNDLAEMGTIRKFWE
jgi:S1-C subfamily serine protease